VHLRPKKIEAAFNAIKTKTKMLITKLHLESHYLHPLIYIIQIQPLVQQRTTFLFPKFNKKHHYKSMDDGKEVYAILHTMPSGKRKRDGINFPP
jgi:hypothetical protein